MSETTDAADRCRETLLEAIASQIDTAPNATTLLRLAEAYAWCVAPGQDHGTSERS